MTAAGAGRSIALVGLRGAGKSTVGRLLAGATGRPFVDLDRAVEARAGKALRALFAEEGEPFFRELETEVLRETLRLIPGGVLATGGGAVERAENRALLRAPLVVYLRVRPELLAERVHADSAVRPALVAGGPLAEARALEQRRDPLFREVADLIVCGEPAPEAVVATLCAELEAL